MEDCVEANKNLFYLVVSIPICCLVHAIRLVSIHLERKKKTPEEYRSQGVFIKTKGTIDCKMFLLYPIQFKYLILHY